MLMFQKIDTIYHSITWLVFIKQPYFLKMKFNIWKGAFFTKRLLSAPGTRVVTIHFEIM